MKKKKKSPHNLSEKKKMVKIIWTGMKHGISIQGQKEAGMNSF